jgi:hypothetical protein
MYLNEKQLNLFFYITAFIERQIFLHPLIISYYARVPLNSG